MMSSEELPGLYVHIPFCKTKCPYCDFYSIPEAGLVDAFLEALKKEAFLYRGVFSGFDSLYFGGGTPSLLTGERFAALIRTIRSVFMFHDDTEVTVEMNPDDVSEELLDQLRAAGVNRISIGIQSLDDKELLFLKRRHSAEKARQALGLVRQAVFDNFAADLMYGLPEQSEDKWIATIEEVLMFRPSHISCYELTIAPETPFGGMLRAGGIVLPSEDRQRTLFLASSRLLRDSGFTHYEVSNFARNEACRSRHNRKYWRRVPYLGLGPSAHSFHRDERWWNVRSVAEYCRILQGNSAPVGGRELLTAGQAALERLFLGLRSLEGVSLADIKANEAMRCNMERLIADHLVEIRDEMLIPTIEGYLLADRLPLLLSG